MASGGLTSELWVDCDSADPLILIFYVLWTFWINFWFLRFFKKYYLCSLLRFLAILRFAMEVSETLTLLLAQCTCPKYSSFLLCSREQDTHMATKKKKIRSSYYILKPYLSFMDCFSCFWRLPSFLPHHHQNAWHLTYSKCSINLWWHKWMNRRVQTINRDTLTVGEFFIIHLITVQEEPSIKWVLRKNKLYILFQQQVF